MTEASTTAQPPLSRLFGAIRNWAEDHPSGTAVAAPDGVMTFAELLEQTRSIAGRLAAAGVSTRTPVGLFTGRSRFAMPSLLAVWWLGATAVLVDERHPADRLYSVLLDADAKVLVAGQVPTGAAPPKTRAVDPQAAEHGVTPVETPAVPARGDCAYLIYTSGTTGWPKGVEVTYANLAVFLDAIATLDLPTGGMGINAVSPAFDGWLWCSLLPLLHGQGVALLDVAAKDNTSGLSELVEAHAPRTVCLTPTLLSALDRIPPAEVFVVAGEPCPPALLAGLAGAPRVLNVYGPTEATIAATWADSARGDDTATIGRPIPGYRVYVLDDAGAPAAEGELYIAGPGVARGYRNRPELTAERFLDDPFAPGQERMYRTGDRVRLRPDGLLEFRGRVDEQVKIRGFRVELGEIEQIAAGVDAVRSVAAFPSAAGDTIGLAVTVVPGADAATCVKLIKERCAARLPDAMVPTTIKVVTRLPALPTGKVDRAALAAMAPAVTTGRSPSSDRERLVCETWSKVLSREVDDVDANFFELGGHSLLAARAIGALRRSTGLSLSVRHLLAAPTAASLAVEMDLMAAGESS
ncbi:amino acid adenylation domain-containing protein [Nonomuraea polychroma]|uniref:Amino acid adenylation domain-containing protein n=1 Tax=Nonomuraea polychroma TaxID=46176 RepID=A0A438LYW9_9ACTN|nr:non-ribosomal peptide synthetase [Nonomuraea polychroma]RVX38735.1 amino acid adenylation domain-containing protein [Nonomuraea polychroma]